MKRVLGQAERILRGPAAGPTPGRVRFAALQLAGFTLAGGALYGAAMGSFGGLADDRLAQVAVSAVKVPLLLLTTFAICLPSFFVLNTLLGVRADFPAALRALLSAQAGLTIVLAALAPYTLLWYASSGSYRWATLFNGLMFAAASFAAQGLLRGWYRPLIARNPRHRGLLWAWLVLYTFVGVQMAWVLRPFVGDPSRPVELFREESWGNAYLILGRTFWETVTR